MFKPVFLIVILFLFNACSHLAPQANTANTFISSKDVAHAKAFKPGKLVIVQGPTSDSETNINVLSPRLKNYIYEVKDDKGQLYSVEKYDSVYQEPLHWKVDKIHVTGLKPGITYQLDVVDQFRSSRTSVDHRSFETLDIQSSAVRFAYASCMADDYRFNEVINPMWARMQEQNPDLVILNGDLVYVDSFEFVARQKATELDIWFRFIDTFSRLPIYHWEKLKPIFATWDDHDFGTNDGDRNFAAKAGARKIFLAFFGGKNLSDVYKLENDSVYFSLNAFHQKMLFMDDRYFRQPNKEQKESEKYAQWGEKQHKWLIHHLSEDATPAWVFNGDQVFSGVNLSYKESLQDNDPEHFKVLLEDMKKTKSPTVFASGDIHFSEIMQIPQETLGFKTYEVTSSSMHSYTGEGWANPLRVPNMFTNEFNFMIIDSKNENGVLKADVQTLGLSDKPYFKYSFEVKR